MVEDVHVHPLHLAHEADLVGVRMRPDLEQGPVLPGQPNRRLAVTVESADDVGVHLAEQDHFRDLDRLRVGDPHALDEANLHSQALHVAGDVGAAAVDDHRVEAHILEQHDVRREALAELLLAHGRTAVLDHHGPPVEVADVRQRLQQRLDAGAHVVYSEFSST